MVEQVSAVLVSQRQLFNDPWFSWGAEVEEVLTDLLHADVVEIAPVPGRVAHELRKRGRLRLAASKVDRLRPYALGRPPRPAYDIAVFVAHGVRELAIIETIPGWERLADRRIAILSEAWPSWFPLLERVIESVVSRFDHVFVPFESAVDELARRSGARVSYLPHGVDVLACQPSFGGDARRIDVSNRGRRDPAQHEAFLQWAAATDSFYLYDTAGFGAVASHAQHRRHYYEQAARSRFFVANHARFDQESLRTGHVEFGLRYFEALSAGAIMVGEHPSRERCERVLGHVPGLLDMPLGSADLPDAMTELLADADEAERVMREHRTLALSRHDVVHRWVEVAAALELDLGPAAARRLERLEKEADAVRPG